MNKQFHVHNEIIIIINFRYTVEPLLKDSTNKGHHIYLPTKDTFYIKAPKIDFLIVLIHF